MQLFARTGSAERNNCAKSWSACHLIKQLTTDNTTIAGINNNNNNNKERY
jgi:hypothetical protein